MERAPEILWTSDRYVIGEALVGRFVKRVYCVGGFMFTNLLVHRIAAATGFEYLNS